MKKGNRLLHESSPYLKQHGHNPVDWYPWGEEALTKARVENKPILLSIGYSACHWCHVMERECFENEQVAAIMNNHYVNIKVDREERPDLDQIYQNVAQLLTRGGGWPLTVFLTPELRPFFGGTYFPPEERYGRPGFPRVLRALADAYGSDRTSVDENTKRLMAGMEAMENPRASASRGQNNGQDQNYRSDAAALIQIRDDILNYIDWKNGGLGSHPKFPNTMTLTYLWRMHLAKAPNELSRMPSRMKDAVILALTKMARGGIYDQLGGGFHRYSVDDHWGVPHFEKMLYDNALLLKLYAEVLLTAPADASAADALTAEERKLFETVLINSVNYLLREMTSPEGGFYSTQDADTEGEEGKYFVWDSALVKTVLDGPEAEAFSIRFGITEGGNFENGQTVLHQAVTLGEVAAALGKKPDEIQALLDSACSKLLAVRSQRVAPHRDEKILAGWNGLMISGLAWAAAALDKIGSAGKNNAEPLAAPMTSALAAKTRQAAEVSFQFVLKNMSAASDGLSDHRLWSVYKDGAAKLNAYLDDYSFLAMAALDLARFAKPASTSGALSDYISISARWVETIEKYFSDKAEGGFFFTSRDHEKLLLRPKNLYDQAIPSGTAVALECMLALSEILNKPELALAADEHLYKIFPLVTENPQGMSELACAALLQTTAPIAAAGDLRALACVFPNVFPGLPTKKPDTAPDTTNVVLCHHQTCGLPLVDQKSIESAIMEKTRLD